MTKTIILTASQASGLQSKIEKAESTGFQSVGSHQVTITHVQNRFAGLQHKDSVYKLEFSITMTKTD